MKAPYDEHFFASHRSGSHLSPREVVPLLMQIFSPRSVVDVGCAEGPWVGEFHRLGVQDVLGIDGDYVDRKMLQIPREKFLPHDLTKPLALGRKFDMAISLEVAEHLPSQCAAPFVALLTSLAPVVIFSAAIPGQGGVCHVNEQWPSYWCEKFNACGFRTCDCIRPRIWSNEKVLGYYRQNMIAFLAEGIACDCGETILDIVHPRTFQGLINCTHPDNISVRTAARQFARSILNAASRRFRSAVGK